MTRRLPLRVSGALVALVTLLSLVACTPDEATFRGHGYGHGRGMSQWGALGYAVDHGWSGTRILDHYYRGTTTRSFGELLGTKSRPPADDPSPPAPAWTGINTAPPGVITIA